jgi:cystathionine gamma-synthase
VQGLEPGDHVIAPNDVYYGFRRIFAEMFSKWSLAIDYVDMRDLDAVRAAVRPSTRLIWIETPSNPPMHITDLEALGKIARAAKAISVCDSTFATPIQQHPFDWDVDMVMHSTTKYIGGHSDVVGGALITKYDNYLFERCRHMQRHGGLVPSPFDCWLTLRGIDTLPYRVRAQTECAGRIAAFLEDHPTVEAVHYPGLPGHSGHAVAKRQMSGFGAMLSIEIRGSKAAAMKIAASVRIFTRATSLGGAHSLIEHRASIEGPGTKTPSNLLRLSIGLEHYDDLIADLDQALA